MGPKSRYTPVVAVADVINSSATSLVLDEISSIIAGFG